MSDEEKIELKKSTLERLFELAKIPASTPMTDDDIMEAFYGLKENSSSSESTEADTFTPSSNNILVIDDIGVVTYQLKIILKNIGYNVQVARDIYTGLNSFIKKSFSFVIMDLFVSTEQEGYTLLNETKKIITKNNLNTKIVVITASNKAENKMKCINGGADYFVKKDTGWQEKIIEIVEGKSS